jgi:hypothetical protein
MKEALPHNLEGFLHSENHEIIKPDSHVFGLDQTILRILLEAS